LVAIDNLNKHNEEQNDRVFRIHRDLLVPGARPRFKVEADGATNQAYLMNTWRTLIDLPKDILHFEKKLVRCPVQDCSQKNCGCHWHGGEAIISSIEDVRTQGLFLHGNES
jgi:hypothetical protein